MRSICIVDIIDADNNVKAYWKRCYGNTAMNSMYSRATYVAANMKHA
jgi:hypothetical protein